jgi:CubicO group peptidase (beta-lactamase class C family)
MKFFYYSLFFLTLALFTQAQTHNRSIKAVSGRSVEISDLDKLITKTMDSLGVPGVAIGIINDAELVYHRMFGVANTETQAPVTHETLFEGASLSKPLFAYFVMKMVEDGVIELDKPLFHYLPHPGIKDNDERYKLITARMVLSHTTGFPNWAHDQPMEMKFRPGTGFSYSGEAYQYLAAVIAVQHKTKWEAGLDSVFQHKIARPLQMQHTTYIEGNEYVRQHKARGHKKGKMIALDRPGKAFGAAYSLHTEVADYAKFLIAMIQQQGLKKSTFSEMLAEQIHFVPSDEITQTGQTGWCLGFSMKPTPYGMRYLHTGNNHDFQAYCCFNKEKKYGLVFFTNCDKAFELYDKVGKYLDDEF